MDIQIERDILLNAVSQIQGVVETRKTIPILSHMLVETLDHQVILFCTDLEVGIRVGIPAEILEAGEIALPAKRFHDILRELPSVPLQVQADKEHVLTIHCERSDFRLKGVPKEDFPQLPSIEGGELISIPTDALRDMIAKTIFAVSSDQTRYSLAGVFFQIKDDIRMVATDGHRLAIVKRPRTQIAGELRREAIIPKKALSEVLRMARDEEETVGLRFIDSQVVFEFRKSTLMARLIEEQFPNYSAVIPQAGGRKAVLNRHDLLAALKRTSAIAGERGTPTTIEVRKDQMLVTCTNLDIGEAKESLDVEYEGEDVAIGFNAKYLMDFLGAIDEDRVVIHLTDSLSPTLFQPLGKDSYQCVIMPMRI
jgi:DNA polymerase III subunit beta